MQDKQALADFVAEATMRYGAVLEQLRAYVQTEERGTAMGELLHVYGGMSGLHSATDILKAINDLEAMPREGEWSAENIQRRTDRLYFDIYTRLNQFAGAAEMSAMRMHAWESKEAFTAAGWQGEKPSEAVTGLASSIQTFFAQHPSLVEQLKAGQNARPGLSS